MTQPLRILSRRGEHLVLLACLLVAQGCGEDEVPSVPPTGDQMDQMEQMEHSADGETAGATAKSNGGVTDSQPLVPESTTTGTDRHGLHGGAVDAKGVNIHEVRASLSVLMVLGETDPHAYVEILSELGSVGTDAAAELALELHANPRLKFEGQVGAFEDLFRSLLRFEEVSEQRTALEAALQH